MARRPWADDAIQSGARRLDGFGLRLAMTPQSDVTVSVRA
jgi:hypothetical protein